MGNFLPKKAELGNYSGIIYPKTIVESLINCFSQQESNGADKN